MIRVLHITEMLQAAGIESFIMNTYRHIDREKVQFDFLITRDEKEFYDEEIRTLGGRKIVVDFMHIKSTFLRVIRESIEIKKILKETDYDIVHIHSGTPLRVFYLIAAKNAGVKTRIYHSHSAKVMGPHRLLQFKIIIFTLLKQLFPRYATDYFACSRLAGEWMFPQRIQDQVKIIFNGIDSEMFKFDEKSRRKYRKVLNIENYFVIGHIGRFNDQKNHVFLIDIFADLVKQDDRALLMLLGEGELFETIRKKVEKLDLTDKVMMLGVRSDIPQLLQAMDVFVLPSNYEGLPVVGIEAQASGNLCLLSDQVTPETVITENVKLLPIDSTNIWVEEILLAKKFKKKDTSQIIKESGYDISTTAQYLQDFYIKRG